MPGKMIPGREIGEEDLLRPQESRSKAASLIKAVKDPAAREALRFFLDKLVR